MKNFFTWLESRIREYEKARARGLKAFDTRWKRVLTERNDGVEPNESSAGFHAPFDGYLHAWVEGDHDFERTYLAGQFLPACKQRESVSFGAFTDDTQICGVPSDRADRFLEQFNQLPSDVRKIVCVNRSRAWHDKERDEMRCYVNVSKCPDDLCAAIDDYLMGDIYKLQRFAEEKAEAERATRDAAHENGQDSPEGRVVITGTVLAFKKQDSDFGTVLKMLVQDDRGFRVWGSVPKALDDITRESRITFTATLTRSDKDDKFAFFKRPTKATQIETEEEQPAADSEHSHGWDCGEWETRAGGAP